MSLFPVTVLGVKEAFPAYVVPSRKPLTLPFHATLSDAAAPVVVLVTQLRGLLANEPVTFPAVMVTSLLLDVQPDNQPFTVEGLVPPPASVSAGENGTLADREQLTEPGAAPAYLGTLAAAGWAIGMISAVLTKTTAAQTPNEWRFRTFAPFASLKQEGPTWDPLIGTFSRTCCDSTPHIRATLRLRSVAQAAGSGAHLVQAKRHYRTPRSADQFPIQE
jgi:hypothetical protein